MTDFATEYGARLRAARMAAELTQTQLAGLLALTRSSVANLEAGRQASSAEQAVTIANALGVGVQWLLTGTTKIAVKPKSAIDRRQLRVITASLRHVLADLDAMTGADP